VIPHLISQSAGADAIDIRSGVPVTASKGTRPPADAARLIKSLGLLTLFLFVATVARLKAIVDRVFQRSIVVAQDTPKSHFQDFPHVTALSLRGSIATPKFIPR